MADKKTFKKPSIKDVAKLADVSVTTVSHVVSQTPGYSAQTIRKVREAIEELNYVPSYVAKGLQRRSTQTIGVCASDPFDPHGREQGSFSDRLWSGILAEADERRYKVMHFPRTTRTSEDPSEFLNGQIDGLIICTNRYDRRPAIAARAGLPVVMVARSFDIPDGVKAVAVNERQIIETGLSFLRDLGHHRIAYLAGPAFEIEPTDREALSYDDVARARLQAYQEWMALNLPGVTPRWQLTAGWDPVDLSSTLRSWFSVDPPTAIFAASDVHARAVVTAAKGLGISVPGDLSVLGIDNERQSEFFDPALSSIEVPIHSIGCLAVRTLLSRLTGDDALLDFVIPAPEIFSRATTAHCK